MQKTLIFELDLEQVYSADDLQNLLEENLPLPDYYGRNLDALFDVLTDGRREVWELHFHHTAEAKTTIGKYIKSLQKMCGQAQQETDKLLVTFD